MSPGLESCQVAHELGTEETIRLQTVGDPLGELMALEHTGEERAARKLPADHGKAIVGKIDEAALVWHRGLIAHVHGPGETPAEIRKALAAIRVMDARGTGPRDPRWRGSLSRMIVDRATTEREWGLLLLGEHVLVLGVADDQRAIGAGHHLDPRDARRGGDEGSRAVRVLS